MQATHTKRSRRQLPRNKRLLLEALEPRILLSSSGLLGADTVWGGVVELDGRLTIDSGVTLTVEPGTVVKAHEGAAITCLGTLDAQGTAADPIVFTSWSDDSVGGDTNADGPSVGEQGDWDGLRLVAAEGVTLEHVEVRYAGVSAVGMATREVQSADDPLGSSPAAELPFPTPLTMQQPAGSLIYSGSATDSLATAADSDVFTLAIDADQTITLRVTPFNATLQPHVELLDPSDVSLGTASAGGAGETALLQTIETLATGNYEILVTGLGGAGDYELEVLLNAAGEEEALGGPANDTPGQAQDIGGSAVALQGDADRLGAVGRLDGTDDVFAFGLDAGDTLAMGLYVVGGDDSFPLSNLPLDQSPV